jgi:hypothetical protein
MHTVRFIWNFLIYSVGVIMLDVNMKSQVLNVPFQIDKFPIKKSPHHE